MNRHMPVLVKLANLSPPGAGGILPRFAARVARAKAMRTAPAAVSRTVEAAGTGAAAPSLWPLAGVAGLGLAAGYFGPRLLAGDGTKQSSADGVDGMGRELAYRLQRWGDLSPFDRRDTALCVVEHGLDAALSEKVASEVRSYAAPRMNPHISTALRHRADTCTAGQEVQADAYRQLAKIASAWPAEQVLEAVTLLDQATHLDQHWNSRVADPVRTVYAGWPSPEESVVELAGVKIASVQEIARFRTDHALRQRVADLYGVKVASWIAADPVVNLSRMAPVDQRLLARELAARGGALHGR